MNISVNDAVKKNLKYFILLIFVTFAGYAFSLNNEFVWDDEQFIYNNVYVKEFNIQKIFTLNTTAGAGESSTYFRPLTTLSFAIDHAIWGLNPFGFHLTNTLLHLLVGLLLFCYLRILKFSKLASLTISSIFLVHPVQTEAVVYTNSRGDSMYALWTMTSLVSFALLLTKKYPRISIYDLKIILDKKVLFFTTIIAYLLAILGKEIGIASLGLLGLTFLFLHLQNQTLAINKVFKNKLEIFSIITSTFIAIAYMLIRSMLIKIPTSLNIYFEGTRYGQSLYVRLHTFALALWNYFKLIFFPYPLHMDRNLEIQENSISIWLVATIILVIALIIIAIKEHKNNKTHYITFGSLWFLCMLIPVSGIIPVNGLIYEHWLYLPMIGFLILMYGLKKLLIPKDLQKNINKILLWLLLIIIFIYVSLTVRQNFIWGHPIRFYEHTLKYANSARLHNNLAMAYADEQYFESAIEEYQKAIEINDVYPQTHYNLGNLYLSLEQYELAKKEYDTAIKMDKYFYLPYLKLIAIYFEEMSYDNITPLVNALLDIYPNSIEFKIIKAQNLISLDKVDEGTLILEELLRAPDIKPESKAFASNLLKRYK